ncbi:tyrosine-type recombinase/integrase [Levilactobacillus parabrevis]|uniref:Prophage Lp2 protein 2, integrase n=1 Tax=Levilactobacillus parabrevis ATCC 53295 TaxID=1267003 RepID=A0A0R1GR03_9LACO|nr:site-specific integrase [Levilactobacillus parabrevis]KRK36328.1 prophage Lp2 protein 2, integrase [Levilactobacillus parabrevis ATCC 53295]KRO05732.1 prophage Lp2 protein 2, integrase [Levilactobacillus parabrevis]
MSRIIKNPCKGKQARPWKAEFSQGSGKKHRTRISSVFDSKREAQSWLAEMVATHATSQYFNRDMLLADYLRIWFKLFRKDAAPATKATYTATSKHVQKYLPTVTLADLNQATLQGFFNALGRTHSKESLRKDLVHLRMALGSATMDGIISNDPTQRIRLVADVGRTRSDKQKFMKKSQYQAVRDELMKQVPGINQISLMVLVVISQTALRVGEALALRFDDINFETGVLHVDESFDTCSGELRPPKTPSAIRDVPVTERLRSMLVVWHKQHSDYLSTQGVDNTKGLLFLRGDGKLPRGTSVNYRYQQLQRRLGFETLFSTHTQRHFLVSQMIQNPAISLTYVSRFLGHSSETITQQYYLGLIPDEIDEQSEQVAQVIAEI